MCTSTRAERRRAERAEKKQKRLSRNVVHRVSVWGGNFRQSQKSLEHQKLK